MLEAVAFQLFIGPVWLLILKVRFLAMTMSRSKTALGRLCELAMSPSKNAISLLESFTGKKPMTPDAALPYYIPLHSRRPPRLFKTPVEPDATDAAPQKICPQAHPLATAPDEGRHAPPRSGAEIPNIAHLGTTPRRARLRRSLHPVARRTRYR